MTTQSQPSTPRFPQFLPLLIGGAAALVICLVSVLGLGGLAWWQNASKFAAPNPQTAVLSDVRGDVQLQQAGQWSRVTSGQSLTAGQTIRTGSFSQATLIFYDRSQARLGANTELEVQTLAAKTFGPRTIELAQKTGETYHQVAHNRDPASVYFVHTPAGGGSAMGTAFRVGVTSAQHILFEVDEGAVAVTNLDVTVIVVAGQATVIRPNQPPGAPVFRITGEGEVRQVGGTWNIAGQTFRTDANTRIVGDPQVGDWVAVAGRLMADGTRLADQIVLLRRAPENRFSLTGPVDSIGEASWTIAGREVRVDALTAIDDGIEVGDTVEVVGGIAPDSAFWASAIRRVDEAGLPFVFTGVVEAMETAAWTISGLSVTTNEATEIEAGIDVGEVVKVEGRTLADGSRVATSIELAEAGSPVFEITGTLEDLDPWTVAGIEFETGSGTDIEDGLRAGDRVKVVGLILDDGRWVAASIRRLAEGEAARFEFIGQVSSTAPWIIGGITLAADDDTQIVAPIAVGDFARVEGQILEDGTWLAEKIERFENSQGCLDTGAIVREVHDGQVVLTNGQTLTLNNDVQIEGDLRPEVVIIIRICVASDGTTIIIRITVILRLDELPTATPTSGVTPRPTGGNGEGDKVTLCHKASDKNRHTITISRSALDAHLAHGDTIGPCP